MKTRSGFVPIFAVGLLLAVGASLWADGPQQPCFRSGYSKPSPPLDMAKLAAEMQAGRMPRFGPHVDASQAEYIYMSLKDLIANAYKVKGYQITGPAWLLRSDSTLWRRCPTEHPKMTLPECCRRCWRNGSSWQLIATPRSSRCLHWWLARTGRS